MPTVAPKERVNIKYQPATGDQGEGLELPLKILMLGDFTQREDETQVEDRKPIRVDKDTFKSVLKEQKIELDIAVPDKLSDDAEDDAQIPMKLKFESLSDFEPEGIVNQVPELRKLLELRKALAALKGPLGNYPKFKKKIQSLLGDEASRQALLKELGVDEEGGGE